jgi:hypothetical protein
MNKIIMQKYQFLKFWSKNFALTSIIAGIISLALTSCSSTNHTINPFYSSFEDDELIHPLENSIVSQQNIDGLTSVVDTGPINGYNIPLKEEGTIGLGFTGQKAFKYECQSILSTTKTKFIVNVYQNLNITIGKNTELSYKLFPDMNGNIEHPAELDNNYPAENIIVDLLINDNNSTANLVSLSSLNMIDENGYDYTPINQGKSKLIFNDQ